MSTMKDPGRSEQWLGRGIYDLNEAARMVGRDPETIARWTHGARPLHAVHDSRVFSFLDVISLLVISELVNRRVPKDEIKTGAAYLADALRTAYPFAHEKLATVGVAVFGNVSDGWVDVGKRGQGAFELVIGELLRPIEYGSDRLAAIWRPSPGVWVNPAVQAGAPCVDGTRIPTRVIAALEEADEHPEDIADDLRLDLTAVTAALVYEHAA